MGNLKKTPRKGLKVVVPSDAKPPETAAETPETPFEPEPAEAAAPTNEKKGRGRPAKKEFKSFWDQVNEITTEQWQSKRYYLYAYLIEPFCNVKTEGEPGYLRKFYQAVDPEFFLNEWGSGKYYLRLKVKPAGETKDHDIETLTFEIFNPQFPPKLPRKLWENDPRNERWLSMLPKEEKPTSQAETMSILNSMFDMQDRIEQRIRGDADERQDPVSQLDAVLNTATKIAEMSKPKEAATSTVVDPWSAAEKILTMRSDNPMVTMLMAQMERMEKSAEAARQREFELQKELRQKADQQPAAEKPKTFLEQMKELAEGFKTISESPLGKVFGVGAAAAGDTGGTVVRSRMSGNMEFFKEVLPTIIDPLKPLINAAAHRLTQPANGQQPVNGQRTNGQPQRPAPGSEDDLIQFVERSLMEPIIEYLNNGSGDSFAELVYNGWPARLKPLQNFTHHQMPGQRGAPVIVELFKHSDVWATQLAHREQQFKEFVQEFCQWRPEGEAPAPEATATASTDTENWDAGESEHVAQEDKG